MLTRRHCDFPSYEYKGRQSPILRLDIHVFNRLQLSTEHHERVSNNNGPSQIVSLAFGVDTFILSLSYHYPGQWKDRQ